MPKYTYECQSCEAVFEVRHGMTEVIDNCTECDSKKIEKRISDFSLDGKPSSTSHKQVGSEVKKFIENAKKEVKEERESLSSRIVK